MEKWSDNSDLVFTDQSKAEMGIGSEMFSDDLNISVSVKLPNAYIF